MAQLVDSKTQRIFFTGKNSRPTGVGGVGKPREQLECYLRPDGIRLLTAGSLFCPGAKPERATEPTPGNPQSKASGGPLGSPSLPGRGRRGVLEAWAAPGGHPPLHQPTSTGDPRCFRPREGTSERHGCPRLLLTEPLSSCCVRRAVALPN